MPLVDAEQHRSFRELYDDFTARRFVVVEISSQSTERQQVAIASNRLLHQLAHDGPLQLAVALGLPTFRLGAQRYFERLTLVTTQDVIRQVFYPIAAPGRHPAEVAARVRAIAI
jgi:peroxiredoxin